MAAATGTMSRKRVEAFGSWKRALVKADPGTRIRIVQAGASSSILVSASAHFGIPRHVFARLIGISPATADRKISAGGLLGQTETERLERVALIENEAEKVFGTGEMARDWLTKKNTAPGATPLSLLDTETRAKTAATAIGDDFLRAGTFLGLIVPSAVMTEAFNIVLNPAHPAFSTVTIRIVRPFGFGSSLR